MTSTETKDQDLTTAQASSEQEMIKGQSAFHVELLPVGVVVRTVFVGENAELRAAPAAVFPNLDVAIHQLDELKRLVLGQFGQAAFIGMQALQHAVPQEQSPSTADSPQAGAPETK